MVNKDDIRFKKGLTNLKELTKKFNLDESFLDTYKQGLRCASILTKENDDLMKEAVLYFESKFSDCFVYYIIYQDTPFGTVVNMLYYNNRENEWYLNDVDDEGWIYAATLNLDMGYMIEFGGIKLGSTENGILCRVG